MSVMLKCLSHTPLKDYNDPEANIVKEVDDITAKARAEVEAFDPELIILFAPDHYNGLFYDLMPPFVVATAAESVGDYKSLPGHLNVDSDTAMDLVKFLFANGIDMTLSHRLQVDHGCTQTLEEMTGSLSRYPVVPIIINSVAPPFCPYSRIRKLGEIVGQFIARLGKRVLILGSGGLSHEPPVPLLNNAPEEVAEFLIAGRNPTPEFRAARQERTIAAGKIYGSDLCQQTPLNEDWDLTFIQTLIDGRVAEIDELSIEEISAQAGRSAHEVRTWVAAFAAIGETGTVTARKDYYRAINEWIAGYGVISAESA